MISALLVVFSGLAGSAAFAEEPGSSTIIAPVLGQLVGFTLPGGFEIQKAQADGGRYFRAAIPKGESIDNWSQLISITGAKDIDKDPKKTAQFIAANISGSIQKLCPDTFSVKPLGSTKINGQDGFVAITSCGKVEPDKHRETALTVAIKTNEAVYTIQWTERTPANAENLTIDEEKWKGRLKQMVPFRVCPVVAGEKVPYPSCTKQ
ncbi:hypothetical protein HYPDE_35508 [Hyphomicrobium denitrificans 1NES1]|uniref:Uncharacterized protein n=2 Tax=Hyphomicrobium denitrificans TaxID=53399 RepID=N0B6X2_9HYPH|nr:hypothetical protein HYPDE_35508 [Hyphomicrobium denitrificans 1NES1]